MKGAPMVDEDGERFRYVVRLLIKHPSIDPNSITTTLGLKPHLSSLVGSPRKTPDGTPLSGVHASSVWGYSVRVNGKKFFGEEIAKMINDLEPHAEFLSKIIETDGAVDLIVHLPGDVNVGDLVSWRDLGRLYALRVNLGIEVFPNFN